MPARNNKAQDTFSIRFQDLSFSCSYESEAALVERVIIKPRGVEDFR